ncbi:MAG: methyltransferase domain-containing protein [Polyangia bacterium]
MSTEPDSPPEREYVLGTGQDELDRLALQHRLWSDAAHAAWRWAGLRPGARALDLGCGPGFAACELAQLVGRDGRVLAVDESPGFIRHLNQQAAARGLPQLHGLVGDVHELPHVLAPALKDPANPAQPAPLFDLAYARWVLCFVRDPAAVVRGVASLLRPGGRFVVHDYFNYRSMALAPRRRSFERVVAATIASWEARGGDSDICGRLPRLLHEAGLRLVRLEVHQRLARGTDQMFAWISSWWRTFAPKLVTMGLFAPADCDELFHDLDEVERSPTDFAACPPVYELVAVKDGG